LIPGTEFSPICSLPRVNTIYCLEEWRVELAIFDPGGHRLIFLVSFIFILHIFLTLMTRSWFILVCTFVCTTKKKLSQFVNNRVHSMKCPFGLCKKPFVRMQVVRKGSNNIKDWSLNILLFKSDHPIPWRDSISRRIAQVSSVAVGDNTTSPLRRARAWARRIWLT
jgi:hypothetical protein